MATTIISSLFILLSVVNGQQVGSLVPEVHPPLTWKACTRDGCTVVQSEVTLDATLRGLHSVNDTTPCYTASGWDPILCPDPVSCAQNCALEGADYAGTYGVTTSGNSITLKLKETDTRLFLMSNVWYYTFLYPLNKELSFDVDVSELPCGVNANLFFLYLANTDGGNYLTNSAKATYGTGYCDAHCAPGVKFINGEANLDGTHGACCPQIDVWEANSVSTSLTAHPCQGGRTVCTSTGCGVPDPYASACDFDGCDFNPYRVGDTTFYGLGKTVDTSKKFTVITQFITNDGTDNGYLVEIRRSYIQDGVVIQNAAVDVPGVQPYTSITQDYCDAQKTAFGDTNVFDTDGGLSSLGGLNLGFTMMFSISEESDEKLDGAYPPDASTASPGVLRGSCTSETSDKSNAQVTFSDIRLGSIGFTADWPASSSSTASASTTSATPVYAVHYGQCGGRGFPGPTVCQPPYKCTYSNQYFSQCL